MTPSFARLDDAFAVIQARLPVGGHLQTDEPFASDNPPGVGVPLRTLTLVLGEHPFALFGLSHPSVGVQSHGLRVYVARRARARRLPYLVLSNLRDAALFRTPASDGAWEEPLRRYMPLTSFAAGADAPLAPTERIALEELADAVSADLLALERNGCLDMVLPDSDFFVGRLTRAVDALKPAVKQALQTKLGMDPQFRQAIQDWAAPQGIPADLGSPDFAEAVVRQAVYRLLGKIIFYQSLRRAVPQLPEMDVSRLDTAQVLPRLNQCFREAHKIDYHAVFREDVVDRLPFPAAASAELRGLVTDLNTRDFAHLPQDVVGAVFERLIPPEERHDLGQFFTPEPLVDLIIAFCVRHSEDKVLDPTCGTGTFLVRAYDRLRTQLGVRDHGRLLSQLWGVDIASFPAELATINLFRQQVGELGNFPRIVNDDFFSVVPGGSYPFPPLKADMDVQSAVEEPIPRFDAIVGNFPYISADRLEQRVKGYRGLIARHLAEDWLRAYPDGFTFKSRADKRQHDLARRNGIDIGPLVERAEPIISTYADLYVSLFWHAAAFLKPGGRMGIVTSNAWLDVGYGYALQRFLLDNFKVIAI
ncbi:MAG: HsdM family class I SAM-dependent methyltransferase, partial [Anaerolineae bacterium]